MKSPQEAAESVRQYNAEQATRAEEREAARAARLAGSRPALTAAGVVSYLDWVTTHVHEMHPHHVKVHLQAAELAIRTLATEAQNKATQHTLVEQGLIEAPPAS